MNRKVIFIILMVLALIFLIYIFYPKKCDNVLVSLDKMITFKETPIESNLEDSLSKVCNYTVDYRVENRTLVTFTSCDLGRVKTGLNRPESLTLNEIRAYILVSDSYAYGRGLVLLKEVYQDDFHVCDPIKSTSASLYIKLYAGSMGSTYSHKTGLINQCLSENSNLTEEEKRECMISVLDAEKAAVDYYSNLEYEGDVNRCVLLRGSIDEYSSFSWAKLFMSSICGKMIDYRREFADKIKESNIDYNQKYFILSSLFLQDNYIGKEDVSKRFEQIIIERINSKYRNLIKPLFQ